MRGRTVTLEVELKRGKVAKTIPLYQWDYGQKLIFTGVELPEYYEVHFATDMHGESVTMVGDETGVMIPDTFLQTGEPIYLWLYLHEGSGDGETEYQGVIPVIKRAEPTDITPTPEEESTIAQIIEALNGLKDNVTEQVGLAEGYADTASTAAQNASDAKDTALDAATQAQSTAEAVDAAVTAAQAAQAAAETAQGIAEGASESASNAASAASLSAGAASTAKNDAVTAKNSAVNAQSSAVSAASSAEGYASSASLAQTAAETAQGLAETAQSGAEDAQTAAETAKTDAETAQGKAEDAQTAAEAAQTAAETAQGKAEDAQAAAEAAQEAAEGARDTILGMTATATGLEAGEDPTVTYSNGVMAFGIPKGDKGDTGDPGDPAEIIDDTAGSGDTDKTFSADKLSSDHATLLSAIQSKVSEPQTEGTSGQVLTTDGNGGRSWTTVQGGGGSDLGLSIVNGKLCVTYEEVSA